MPQIIQIMILLMIHELIWQFTPYISVYYYCINKDIETMCWFANSLHLPVYYYRNNKDILAICWFDYSLHISVHYYYNNKDIETI